MESRDTSAQSLDENRADPPREPESTSYGSSIRFVEEAHSLSPETEKLPVIEEHGLVAELFNSLATRIRSLREHRPLRTIGIVSAMAGEGKSTVAVGLAFAMARSSEQRLLLIDGDLRRPHVESYLGLTPAPGLAEFLQSESALTRLRRLGPHGPRLLAPGRSDTPTTRLLSSPRLVQIIESASRAFETVIVDCPPLQPVADGAIFEQALDAVILVVRAGKTSRETIERARSSLQPDSILGVIFNDYRERIKRYDSQAYRQYAKETNG